MKKLLLFLIAFSIVQLSLNAQVTVFSDDFENGTANWDLEGAWGTTTAQANSGTTSLTDSPGGNYLANQNISATLATGIDMTSALDAELKLAAIYDIENGNFDYWYIEASADGGTTWVNIATIFGEGNLTPWVDYTYSLGGFVGNSDVKIRFRFFTDGGYEVDGVYIDDVEIITNDMDNANPLVIHDGPELYESQAGDITMTAEIIDISGVASTTLSYSVDGGSPMQVSGTNTSMNTWQYVIPEQAAGSQVDYSVEAVDASSNANTVTTGTFSYIAGQHVFYDTGVTDFINGLGPANAGGITGAAVRFSLFGNDIKYALIRNYTDQNNPNDDMEFHIWADDNGVPGADLITPFTVTPEANLVETSPMTRIDLSAYSAELSNISGDVFMGYIATGTTFLTQTTPAVAMRSFVFNGTTWGLNANDDYHFRLVTTATMAADECADATNIDGLLGGGIGNPITSPIFNNDDATTSAADPADGWDCFLEQGGATLDNTQWFTFTGDGELYSILTTDCNGTAPDYIDDGDTQIAIYSGTDCTNLTPVACNDDVLGTPSGGPYPAGLDFETEAGVTYYIMVDGWGGSNGDYCIEFTQVANITCADAVLNDATITNPNVCFGDATNFELSGSVIPLSPLSGFIWGIFTADVTGSDDPFNNPNVLGFFPASATEYAPALVNDGTQVAAGTYFFVPIIWGSAVDTVGDNLLTSLSFTDGCVITGTAVEVTLLPEWDDLTASSSSVPETAPGNGEASVDAMGGSGGYEYAWSNGGTTSSITGLTGDTYTVTITDPSGCVDDLVVDVIVESTISAEDLIFAESIEVAPNPAREETAIRYNFTEVVDLTLTLTNSIGQVVLEQQIDNAKDGQVALDLQQYTNGVYFVKLTDGKHQSVRQLVINK